MKIEEFGNGAIREDKEGKGRFDLIPWCTIMRIAKHMQESLKVYKPRNWEQGLPMHSMLDSAIRHLAKYMDGWDDEDHLCAAATNLLMAMWTEEKKPQMQDIPSRNSSLCQGKSSAISVNIRSTSDNKSQGKAKEAYSLGCDCYDGDYERCLGTKDAEQCKCGGNLKECDFYDYKRGDNGKS